MINVIRCDVYLSSQTTYSLINLKFVNYFRAAQNQHMLFWLLKDA